MTDCFLPLSAVLKILQELQDRPRYQELDIGANFLADIMKEIKSMTLPDDVEALFTPLPYGRDGGVRRCVNKLFN